MKAKLFGLLFFVAAMLTAIAAIPGIGPTNSVMGISTNGQRTEWKSLVGAGTVTIGVSNRQITITGSGSGGGGGDTNANFLFFGETNAAYPNGRTLAVGGIISIATNGTNITITGTEVGTVTDAQLANGTNSVKNYADATFQPLSATLTGWASIATNLVVYLSQLGTAAYSNATAFIASSGGFGTNSTFYQITTLPLSVERITNGTFADSGNTDPWQATSVSLSNPDGYLEVISTAPANALAFQTVEVLPSTYYYFSYMSSNETAYSTVQVYGNSSGLLYNKSNSGETGWTNHYGFFTTGSDTSVEVRLILTGATESNAAFDDVSLLQISGLTMLGAHTLRPLVGFTNLTAYTNADGSLNLSASASGSGTFTTIQSNGVVIVTNATTLNVVNPSALVSNANGVATLTLPTGGGGSDYVTNSGGLATNLTVYTELMLNTNAPLTLYGSGYGSGSDYSYGRVMNTSTGLNIMTLRAGSATTNGMPLRFFTDGVERMHISPSGTVVISNALAATGALTVPNWTAGYTSSDGNNLTIELNAALRWGAGGTAITAYPGGRLRFQNTPSGTIFNQLTFGNEAATNVAINTTNLGTFKIVKGDDFNGAAPVAVFSLFGTNFFAGTNTFMFQRDTNGNAYRPLSGFTNITATVHADGTLGLSATASGGGAYSEITNISATEVTNIWINAGSMTNMAGIHATITLTTNMVLNAPTNASFDGQIINLRIIQDATGNRTLTTNGNTSASISFGTDIIRLAISTNAGAIDYAQLTWMLSAGTKSNTWHLTRNILGY